ncbi:hypothetical protein [Streptomyces sp. NPDC056291]
MSSLLPLGAAVVIGYLVYELGGGRNARRLGIVIAVVACVLLMAGVPW